MVLVRRGLALRRQSKRTNRWEIYYSWSHNSQSCNPCFATAVYMLAAIIRWRDVCVSHPLVRRYINKWALLILECMAINIISLLAAKNASTFSLCVCVIVVVNPLSGPPGKIAAAAFDKLFFRSSVCVYFNFFSQSCAWKSCFETRFLYFHFSTPLFVHFARARSQSRLPPRWRWINNQSAAEFAFRWGQACARCRHRCCPKFWTQRNLKQSARTMMECSVRSKGFSPTCLSILYFLFK